MMQCNMVKSVAGLSLWCSDVSYEFCPAICAFSPNFYTTSLVRFNIRWRGGTRTSH